jgi:hypothetical protein
MCGKNTLSYRHQRTAKGSRKKRPPSTAASDAVDDSSNGERRHRCGIGAAVTERSITATKA